jgi:hypothetical protein
MPAEATFSCADFSAKLQVSRRIPKGTSFATNRQTWNRMSDEQTQSNTDVSLLQHTINLFLKEALPYLALDACADAILRSVVRSLPAGKVVASLWRPGQRPNTRYRMELEGETVTHRESNEPDFLAELAKETSGLEDDLRILLHRSLKSLTSDPPAAEILREAGCRAAIEIRFCYYGRIILQIIFGSRSAKGLITKEAEDFLALFCRCCLISLQGSYIAEMEEKSVRPSCFFTNGLHYCFTGSIP